MKETRINIKFSEARALRGWKETRKRPEHVFDRMRLRGIGIEQIREAIQKGAKKLWKDGRVTAEYKWFGVVYREFMLKETRKIYPITVYIL